MIDETLGEHLRHLMSQYKSLIELILYLRRTGSSGEWINELNINGLKSSLQEMLEFSQSDIMESTFWTKSDFWKKNNIDELKCTDCRFWKDYPKCTKKTVCKDYEPARHKKVIKNQNQ